MAESQNPNWDETSPIENQAPSPSAAPLPASQSESPTWDNTFDPEEKYGSVGQQALTAAEGVGKGLAGPLAPLIETKLLNVPAEDITGREETNPGTHLAGEATGLLAPAIATAGTSLIAPEAGAAVRTLGEFTQAGLLGKIGKAGAAAAEKVGLGTAGKFATQFGTENALFTIGSELSKAIQGNPDNIQTAAVNVGLSGLLGGAGGAAFGKVSDLWKGKFGPEAEGFLKDFKGRLADHANGNIPAADAITSELEKEYTQTTAAKNNLSVPQQLKTSNIPNEFEGLDDSQSLDPKAQSQITQAFSEHAPSLKDFEKTFTEKIGGEAHISPGKINTLVNQIGKPNAEIKLSKLSNYLEASDKLHDRLAQIHSDLGIENPYERPGFTATRAIVGNMTPGMKAADFVRKQALNMAAEGASDLIGAGVGHASGIPGGELLGGYFGHYAIKPLMKTILPTLINPVMGMASSAVGMKAAFEAVGSIVKADALSKLAAESIFSSADAVPSSLVASNKDIEKLDEKLKEYGENPTALISQTDIGHYLPDHATALGKTVGNAITYLNSQRPKESKPGILDTEIKPSHADKMKFQRALSVAQQPLSVLERVKEGTLQSKDVQNLQNLYPALYQDLKTKVYTAMIDHVSKGGTVPYSKRMGLSVFLAQPMDSTLTPQAIQAAQSTFLQAGSAQPQQQAQAAKKSTSELSKLSTNVQTPIQARAASKLTAQ